MTYVPQYSSRRGIRPRSHCFKFSHRTSTASALLAVCLIWLGPRTLAAAQQQTTPGFVVNTTADDATGVAANCMSGSATGCTLRDALAAAAAAAGGQGNITFDPTVFATPQTITLDVGGGLVIPSNTTIDIAGPTAGSGATLQNLVTVSGGGPVFTVNTATAVISGLTITGGGNTFQGGGILNNGTLTVSGCTISGNSSQGNGGGVANFGSMTLINSTVSGNIASAAAGFEGTPVQGGGIFNQGTLTITNSTIAGNSASSYPVGAGITNLYVSGGGIDNESGALTMTNSTVAANTATGSVQGTDPVSEATLVGAGIAGSITGDNNIISGNTTNGSEDDWDCNVEPGSGPCPNNGPSGNLVGASPLAPLGNYGGPTQTVPPLPGSPAICGGIVADIPAGVSTDQRGFPRTTTYGSNPPCVDSGAVQTNYSLAFSIQPPPSVAINSNFAAALQLSESGSPFPVNGVSIPVALASGDPGSLNVSSLTTNAAGIAGSSTLQVNSAGTGDTLIVVLQLTTAPPPAPLTGPISITATSSPFDVNAAATPTITWTPAGSITYGTVAASLLSATANTPGAFTYTAQKTGGSAIPLTAATILTGGSYTLTVNFVPTDTVDYKSATQTAALTVTQAMSTTTLTSSTATANLNASVTFTATITSSAPGVATGSVEFLNGSTALGTAPLNNQGVATYMTSSLPAGLDTINAVYSGDQNFQGSMSSLMQQVIAPAFSLASSATQLSIAAGQTGQLTITLTPVGGYTGTMNFSCTGVPQNSTCTFNPTALTANGSNTPVTTTLTIATDVSTASMAQMEQPQSPGTTDVLASLAGFPACFAGLILFTRRKRLSLLARRSLCAIFLIAGLVAASAGIAACGGGSSKSSTTTPPGTSTITITATGTGNSSQSITVMLTVTQ